MPRSPLARNKTEEDIAQIVASHNEYIANKFDVVGKLALLNVISSEIDHTQILEHLQFLRGCWTGCTKQESINRYYRKHGIL